MESFYLASILIFNGLLASFFSGSIFGASFEELISNVEKNNTKTKFLVSLRDRYEDSPKAFVLVELFLYLISFLLVAFKTYETSFPLLYSVLLSPIAFVTIAALRTLSFSIGLRAGNITLRTLAPLLYFLSAPCRLVDKLLDKISVAIIPEPNEDSSLQELSEMVDNAREEGSIAMGEYKILKNLIKFNEVFVSDIMTPRTVIFSCASDETIDEALKRPEIQMYSRIPLREGESLDDGATGYAMTKDLFRAALNGNGSMKLKELAREIDFVPENGELDVTLDLFLKRKQHIFLVVDEYGGIEGLITMEDIIETILGAEIIDEADKVADLRELAKQRRDKRIAVALAQNEN
jgi:CBS domain containing-hemolysin-like protein